MKQRLAALATAGPLLIAGALASANAQQAGGTLRIGHFDSPASMSMHEESTAAVNRPMMAVFNNLVIYKQDVKQNGPDAIVPELATSWRWSEDGTELTFPLRQGVNGMTGHRSPLPMSNAPSNWCRVPPRKSSASTRANRGTST